VTQLMFLFMALSS